MWHFSELDYARTNLPNERFRISCVAEKEGYTRMNFTCSVSSTENKDGQIRFSPKIFIFETWNGEKYLDFNKAVKKEDRKEFLLSLAAFLNKTYQEDPELFEIYSRENRIYMRLLTFLNYGSGWRLGSVEDVKWSSILEFKKFVSRNCKKEVKEKTVDELMSDMVEYGKSESHSSRIYAYVKTEDFREEEQILQDYVEEFRKQGRYGFES